MARLCLVALALQHSRSFELHALDPVAVGHVRRVPGAEELGIGALEMETLSTDPLVFRIPGLLRPDEADELLALARSKGQRWISSSVDNDRSREEKMFLKRGKSAQKTWARFDRDGDGKLSLEELDDLAKEASSVTAANRTSLSALLGVLQQGPASAGAPAPASDIPVMAAYENRKRLIEHFKSTLREQPWRGERYSRQTWIQWSGAPELLRALLRRASVVTGLPMEVLKHTEDVQVVHYSERGHYSCHHDSAPDAIEQGDVRLGTLGVILRAPESGGETVFPGAFRSDTARWGEDEWGTLEEQCQPYHACAEMGGLKVQPRKGDAIFWYNVRPSLLPDMGRKLPGPGVFSGPETLMWSSVHCAAQVREGEKYFANMWFRLPEGRRQQRSEL